MTLLTRLALLCTLALLSACGNSTSIPPSDNGTPSPTVAVPDDAAVLAEMKARIQGASSIELSKEGRGEVSWSSADGTWFFDRGYIVRRPANIDGFPDATLEVGGLTRWMFAGNGWRYQRDLVTWNTYDGIPNPDEDDLIALLESANVNYQPLNMAGKQANFRMADPANFEWHNATSVSFNYVVDAQRAEWQKLALEQAEMTLRTRVYRDSVDAPWRDPLQPELVSAKVTGSTPKTAQELSTLTQP